LSFACIIGWIEVLQSLGLQKMLAVSTCTGNFGRQSRRQCEALAA
jgi:hypothetical protein